ncbi:putative secreted protein [Salmonella bongori]|nr:putative secreted protein [Salmonella bongori]
MGEDLNAQHQQITHTREGVWAANSGSIQADEAALTSNKPLVQGHPELMPHQG